MADLKRFLSRFCEPRSILSSLLLRLISPKYLVYRLRRLSNAYHLFTALFTAKCRSQCRSIKLEDNTSNAIYILQLVAGFLLANTKHGTRVPRYRDIFTILYRFSSHLPHQSHRKIKVVLGFSALLRANTRLS